ncbi:hypothetical protein [Apilactobacillus timberlakei]|uniref:hypothetical protein n=1 Tax=Apilactobacillus timberlakei TaxID=2008380 RepID=UPI001CDC2B35|nr:hypothetical protein [Apilactobacillus timberlakei]
MKNITKMNKKIKSLSLHYMSTLEDLTKLISPNDYKRIDFDQFASKLENNIQKPVVNVKVHNHSTFLYQIKVNDNLSIITDVGYILKSANITNIFAGKNNSAIKTFINEYAINLNISFINLRFISANISNADMESIYNSSLSNYFVVVNNSNITNENLEDIYNRFNKLKESFQKISSQNANVPIIASLVDDAILNISLKNKKLNHSSKFVENYQIINDKQFKNNNIYNNNDFKIKFTLDNKKLSPIQLNVERVPNEIIKVNDNNYPKFINQTDSENVLLSLPVVVIRDYGMLFNKINNLVDMDDQKIKNKLIDLVEKSTNYKVKIKHKDQKVNTNIQHYHNDFPLKDSELVLLGADYEINSMLEVFEKCIYDISNFINYEIKNTSLRIKINALIKSELSAYRIGKDFNIASNRISELRTGRIKLGNLSLDTCERLEKAFMYYSNHGEI